MRVKQEKKNTQLKFSLCVFFPLPFCRNFWSRPRCQDILAQNQSVSGTYGPKYGPHVEFWCGCPWAVHSSLPDLDHELALITVRLPKIVIYVNIQTILPEKDHNCPITIGLHLCCVTARYDPHQDTAETDGTFFD